MRVRLNKKLLLNNLKEIKKRSELQGVGLTFMIKKQLYTERLSDILKGEHVYTSGKAGKWEDIYKSKRITVVDAYDRREGLTIREAMEVKDKSIAVVNFCCCNGMIPTPSTLREISETLHCIGFKVVSFGGSLMLGIDCRCISGDEIRIGEALLTGYSAEPYKCQYENLKNPFRVDLKVWSSSKDGVVVKNGFFDIGGFTDAKTKCVNTDFTVIDVGDWEKYKKGSIITLKPDYYTLIKAANKQRVDIGNENRNN